MALPVALDLEFKKFTREFDRSWAQLLEQKSALGDLHETGLHGSAAQIQEAMDKIIALREGYSAYETLVNQQRRKYYAEYSNKRYNENSTPYRKYKALRAYSENSISTSGMITQLIAGAVQAFEELRNDGVVTLLADDERRKETMDSIITRCDVARCRFAFSQIPQELHGSFLEKTLVSSNKAIVKKGLALGAKIQNYGQFKNVLNTIETSELPAACAHITPGNLRLYCVDNVQDRYNKNKLRETAEKTLALGLSINIENELFLRSAANYGDGELVKFMYDNGGQFDAAIAHARIKGDTGTLENLMLYRAVFIPDAPFEEPLLQKLRALRNAAIELTSDSRDILPDKLAELGTIITDINTYLERNPTHAIGVKNKPAMRKVR